MEHTKKPKTLCNYLLIGPIYTKNNIKIPFILTQPKECDGVRFVFLSTDLNKFSTYLV